MTELFALDIVDCSLSGKNKIIGKLVVDKHESERSQNLHWSNLNDIIQNHLSFFQEKENALLLASNERIKTCEEYLINHMDISKDEKYGEIECIAFFTMLVMLYDCLKQIFQKEQNAVNTSQSLSFQCFKSFSDNIQKVFRDEINVPINTPPNDSEIIEFLRSILFVHPIDTNRAGFLRKANKEKKTFYCPWAYLYGKNININLFFDDSRAILKLPLEELQNYTNSLIAKIDDLVFLAKKKIETIGRRPLKASDKTLSTIMEE